MPAGAAGLDLVPELNPRGDGSRPALVVHLVDNFLSLLTTFSSSYRF
jgi:hypothetical protein